MHITESGPGSGPGPDAVAAGAEPCRFPKLEECAHFHYERVQLPKITVTIQNSMDQSLHSQHSHDDGEWHMVQVSSGEECWLLQRNLENFRMLDSQLHQCIYDRKISLLPDLCNVGDDEAILSVYLERFSHIADNSVNCGPVLNWLQMDNKGHRLLVPSEESRSINTPAVAAAYSVRRYVSQARDELNLEVGDMISVIDMASPGESIWWRGKRGFQVGFFPQHCVHIIGDKVPRNMPLPPPVVGSLALSPIKPVLRKHGKLIAFFRSFILNRPSRRRLKQSGILRERVFGCDLGEHLLNSGHDIPTVLKCCAEFIEKNGIVDGIYRLSGVTSNIQKLRNAFDEDRIPNLYTEDILQDIHSVASLLKMYFRELPNPLCTYQLYQSFVNAVQGCNTSIRNSETDHERLLKMREAVQKLPPPHYRTLEYLMRHLAKVAKHGHSTGMTTRNVAIVWAPNLLRCAELEVGGVAALQGVGVQAVVTEFLICYADLIFCDNLPDVRPAGDRQVTADVCGMMGSSTLPSPKRSRPKSLAISTPTKLITLEEARSKHLLNSRECGYIEVGGGPDSLPKKYHTVIELPHGARKRGLAKRSSPSGWRSFFTKSRNSSQSTLVKPRKVSTPGIVIAEKAVTETDLADMRRKLRTVKSAESLTSGHSEPTVNDIDILAPLHSLSKPPGHNRSVSHDSYFDTLQQSSQNNSEMSLLDLSEIQLNFELEESEMRIFSEDESLVSSPRVQRDGRQIRPVRHHRYEDVNHLSANPSPRKARAVISPESMSRKRTRLEDQLSDIQYIDCGTPDNIVVAASVVQGEEPRNKSPRSSEVPCEVENNGTASTPQSPIYKRLVDSSSATTPGDFSPTGEVIYQKLVQPKSPAGDETPKKIVIPSPAKSPTYENVLTTISITYKSPSRSRTSSTYEEVKVKTESAEVPTTPASLPLQEATTETDLDNLFATLKTASSLTDLSLSEVMNSSSEMQSNSNGSLPMTPTRGSPVVSPTPGDTTTDMLTPTSMSKEDVTADEDTFPKCDTTLSELYDTYDQLAKRNSNDWDTSEECAYENVEFREKPNELIIPAERPKSINLIEFSPMVENPANEKRKQGNDDSIYQQVKYFRRSIHEVNALLQPDDDAEDNSTAFDSLETHVYENIEFSSDSLECKTTNTDPPAKPDVKALANKFESTLEERVKKGDLPPCLRARNLKNTIKTRSLDEEEFCKEFDTASLNRRKSLDENISSNINTLPKKLNQPKKLPDEPEMYVHLTHSQENMPNLNRERIEKYKEERRKYLHDKYRSESFKEDKDVLLSRLKIFKPKDEDVPIIASPTVEAPEEIRRTSPKRSSIRAKTAIFEGKKDEQEEGVRRKREPNLRRERETAGITDEKPRREKTSPSYCIKDMKAIFEQKSHQ